MQLSQSLLIVAGLLSSFALASPAPVNKSPASPKPTGGIGAFLVQCGSTMASIGRGGDSSKCGTCQGNKFVPAPDTGATECAVCTCAPPSQPSGGQVAGSRATAGKATAGKASGGKGGIGSFIVQCGTSMGRVASGSAVANCGECEGKVFVAFQADNANQCQRCTCVPSNK
ncbi:hypothetical protein PLICBS_009597 [Purpureocillium lilacinum]|uniref:uncharacterized protein n=1 Tax=Purpureocillium lilacinum TaxID=33203 RepID=UPI0020885AD7|nr:hypothetical protein PLICBS_009597 [Purpureocillium lilacinum]